MAPFSAFEKSLALSNYLKIAIFIDLFFKKKSEHEFEHMSRERSQTSMSEQSLISDPSDRGPVPGLILSAKERYELLTNQEKAPKTPYIQDFCAF